MYPNGNILSKNTIEAATGGVLLRKGVFRNFAKFTGKHPSQGLYFNKVAGLRPHVWATAS